MAARCVFKHVQPKTIVPQMHIRCAASATVGISGFEIQHRTPSIIKVMPIPKAHYGGRHTVTLLPGAGIGPELMGYVKEVNYIFQLLNNLKQWRKNMLNSKLLLSKIKCL